jgi:hypothetical protein
MMSVFLSLSQSFAQIERVACNRNARMWRFAVRMGARL